MFRRSAPQSCQRLLAKSALFIGLGLSVGCGPSEPVPVEDPSGLRERVPASAWGEMIQAEELVHTLGPALRQLSRSVSNVKLPDRTTRPLFAPVVETTDLRATTTGWAPISGTDVSIDRLALTPGAPATRAPMHLALWGPLLQETDHFEHVSFGVLEARFEGDDHTVFRTRLRLQASARGPEGEPLSVRGSLTLIWTRGVNQPASELRSWRIRDFRTEPIEVLRAARPLFAEVLDAVVTDPQDRARARRSIHEELARRNLRERDDFEPPHPHFFMGSQDRHPGISVGDVNGDGWDDLYVMARWGPNQLFIAQGDGTFREDAASFGLDLRDHSSSAIFGDFDNDGDLDLFVGRTLLPSVHLENREGRFVAVAYDKPLPSLVSSVSAADLDGDGLLDLYVSTYAAQMLVAEMQRRAQESKAGRAISGNPLAAYLDPEDAARLSEETRAANAHMFLELPGPPNHWLRNRGGHFVEERSSEVLRSLRNTYQTTLADFDSDGDPDLYLAHDFAPNQMLENLGEGRFRDITAEMGTADIGFGMGASFGDYDGDGRFDLYVSNMYSKAGRRITDHFPEIDDRFRKMARGNSLFRQGESGFEKVSGEGPGKLPVEKAGWAWGGQFTDVDNDGLLDLLALSGYYTSPDDTDVAVDI